MDLIRLRQAVSFRTRHHFCRQGVELASTRQLRSQGPVSVHAHRTEGVTVWEGRERANGVGGWIGVGSGNGDGGGNGDVDGNGDGHGEGTWVKANEGTQDESGDRSGNGAGTGTGAGTETRAVVERRMGKRMIAGTGMKTRSGGTKERRRSAINRTSVVDAMWETMEA